MEFNVKLLAAALAVSLNLILIVFISLRNRYHIVYRAFVLISFCLLFWNLRVIISNLLPPTHTDSLSSILITQIFYPMVTACLYILPVATLQFTSSFIRIDSKIVQYVVRTAFAVAFILSLLYASQILSNETYSYILWSFTLPLYIVSIFLIGRAYFRAQRPLERTRLGLLLVAGAVGVTGAITEDILTTSGVNAGGLGNIANASYSLLVAICLFRHRLFDVRVTTRRTLSFAAASILLLVVSYAIFRFFRMSKLIPYGYAFLTTLLLLTFGRRLVSSMEKILFGRSEYLPQTIDSIRYALDKAQNMGELLKISGELTHKAFGVTKYLSVALDETTKKYRYYWPQTPDINIITASEAFANLALWISAHGSSEPSVYDEMRHNLYFGDQNENHKNELMEFTNDMERIGYEVCAPLMFAEKLEGMILLGEKDNLQAYTESDIRFLKILSYNCSLRLQHLKMLDRIRQLEGLAALGEMAAYIAHEVKNPLAVIRSSAQLIKSENPEERTSDMIIEECDRLNRVITQMLHLSKTPVPRPGCINIEKEITQWALDILKSQTSNDIGLSVECASGISDIVFDPDHLKQVITNLLLNAVEAMRGHGQLIISIKESQNMVQLAIIDNGPGIDYHDQGGIFQPFYTTKPGGSGLGLPITRRLLELNNGTIEIDSRPGKGCTAKLSLPIWSEKV
jgi:signal transduction histidine kinase